MKLEHEKHEKHGREVNQDETGKAEKMKTGGKEGRGRRTDSQSVSRHARFCTVRRKGVGGQ